MHFKHDHKPSAKSFQLPLITEINLTFQQLKKFMIKIRLIKIDFIYSANGHQGNCCSLTNDIAWGLILENKVPLYKLAKGITIISCLHDL